MQDKIVKYVVQYENINDCLVEEEEFRFFKEAAEHYMYLKRNKYFNVHIFKAEIIKYELDLATLEG